MTISNSEMIKRAEDLTEREGGLWTTHLGDLLKEAQLPPLQKLVKKSDPKDVDLRKAAVVAQLRHLPGEGDPDPDRRIEIGECETELGRVRVAVERDSIEIHGVHAQLSELDGDLREAIVSTSSAFAAAVLDVEQTSQRSLVGFVVAAILRRNQWLTAKVKEVKTRERYDV